MDSSIREFLWQFTNRIYILVSIGPKGQYKLSPDTKYEKWKFEDDSH